MTNCTSDPIRLKGVKGRRVEAIFSGQTITPELKTIFTFADQTSCSKWLHNQFRVLLAAMAYAMIHAIMDKAFAGTESARARCGAIRLKNLKTGAATVKNTR